MSSRVFAALWIGLALALASPLGCGGSGGGGGEAPGPVDADIYAPPEAGPHETAGPEDVEPAVDGATDAVPELAEPETAAADADDEDVAPMDTDEPREAGPTDLCAGVDCPDGEACDPATGLCARVGTPPGSTAGPCDEETNCTLGECVSEEASGIPGGFCNVSCEEEGACAEDTLCVAIGTDDDGDPRGVCVDACADGSLCREGWVCRPAPDAGIALCLPDCRLVGCALAAYCDGATGLCVPIPDDGLAVDDPCSVTEDACGERLVCLPEDASGAGTCRPVCLVDDDFACGPREACLSVFAGRVPAYEDVGVCLRGDDCDPLTPETACGPDSSCSAFPPATFCVPTGDAELGDTCGDDEWCVADLVCHLGICMLPCGAGGGCADETPCVDYTEDLDGLPFRVCYLGCDVFAQTGCAGDDRCILGDVDADGRVRGLCVAGDDGDVAAGAACALDPDHYWGTCAGASMCSTFLGGAARCLALCDDEHVAVCGDQMCADGIFLPPFESLGLCLGGCQVLGAESGCAAGEVCSMLDLVGWGQDGEQRPVGVCRASHGAGLHGAPCGFYGDGLEHDCANGHICLAPRPGDPTECTQVCDAEEASGACAAPDTTCVTGIFARGDPRYGACLPH